MAWGAGVVVVLNVRWAGLVGAARLQRFRSMGGMQRTRWCGSAADPGRLDLLGQAATKVCEAVEPIGMLG